MSTWPWRTLVRRVELIEERLPVPQHDPHELFDSSRLTAEQLQRCAYFRGILEAAGDPNDLDPEEMGALFTSDELMELAELRSALMGTEQP
jgi:hypothetical protein